MVTKTHTPEWKLQVYLDEQIAAKGCEVVRFPDALLSWMKRNAPADVQRAFFGAVAGMPDNTITAQVGQGLHLSMRIEIKTEEGKLHGKQKHGARGEGWVIVRSEKEIDEALLEFERAVEGISLNIKFKEATRG